jgi:hypothetical protein
MRLFAKITIAMNFERGSIPHINIGKSIHHAELVSASHIKDEPMNLA